MEGELSYQEPLGFTPEPVSPDQSLSDQVASDQASPKPISPESVSPKTVSPEPALQDLLTSLVMSSRKVPCAFHLEPTHCYIVSDESLKQALSNACFNLPIIQQAPYVVIYAGDRFCARQEEMIIDEELERQRISVDEAERRRRAIKLHFDTGPVGLGWLVKLIAAPIMHLITPMPLLPCVHKREWLIRQVSRHSMTFFWEAIAQNLAVKIIDSYDEWRLRLALNMPWHHVVVSVMLVGHCSDSKKYEPIEDQDVLHWNKR